MWSSRLFWKLFLAYTGLILLAIIACVVAVSGWQEEQLIERIYRRLHDSATLLAIDLGEPLAGEPSELLQQRIRDLGKQTQTRFTLVASDGRVFADSEQVMLNEVLAMKNHLDRREFQEASRTGEGFSQRLSPTLGVPFLYFALVVKEDGNVVGYVRAAQSLASVREAVSAIHWLIWKMGFVVGLLGLAISYWLTRRIIRPVQVLTEAVQNLADGQYDQRIDVPGGDEIGMLARSFEHMSSELGARERLLRENAQRQTTVLSGMIEGVIAVDRDSRILFANSAAGQILGFSSSKVEGRNLREVVRSDDLHEIVGQTLNQGNFRRREMQWEIETVLSLDVYATPLPGDPCPGVVLVLHNVSELKRLEGLRQQFVANVSHELKTPLSSIKAYAETLLNGALEDRENARRFLQRIDDQADRLHELILDMLSLARIESGTATLDLADISLAEVVLAALVDHEPRAQANQVILRDGTEDHIIRVRGDEEALQQILSNLIGNAIKYTPAGGTITVHCHREANEAVIEVTDTGIGIAAKHHERLFERFYRVDKARSRELGGTGLGLSIVKHLCQVMGGSVAIESELGQGSTFRVRIPLITETP